MEHKYELLRKCHGLRFRATLCDKKEEGIIKVGEDGITLCYGAKDPGRMFIFERTKTLSFTEQTFGFLPNDFEIVPRDPETYHDWQVGDKISRNDDVCTVVLRCGEVVLYKYEGADGSRCCTCPYICEELFRDGCRLVLTDIEKQIIDEKKKYEPQDGDICYVESRKGYKSIFIYKAKSEPESESESKSESNRTSYYVSYGGKELERVLGIAKLDVQCMVMVNNDIKFLRPALEDEKQQLFDAMAKKGKRWNAERKVVEDIKPEDDEAVDVQKMISDALKGYIPKGDIEGFPVEVIAKMLERQYEQTGEVSVSVFEKDKIALAYQSGFDWDETVEGDDFWWNVIIERDFSIFFKMYPKAEAPGAGIPSFKRFDTVLVRDKDDEEWHPMVFSRKEGDKFYVLSVFGDFVYYNQCIPLNKDTEELIGTSKQYYEK